MVSLGQKFKMLRNAKNHSTKRLELFCRKSERKNTQYSRNEKILKIGRLAKAIAHPKAIALQNRHFGSKLKNPKNRRKTILEKG